ncbi:acyl-CoA synthetase (AMP-forming)/AMP-acid ligase II [Tamaricihabitans halophyticus]|uniref:Acyl-CoA synthetase (AMP-forming)/AMP-acid ligase II n=1 Tax=Tamaricihabitans halophyticus TaxID=1262583 RepID=A0A4R2QFB4_9PSEU|nr:class I adenylate-forming enzyme family protein [Tamaricihabitans halophyticus]TCP45751.1 acyl-CoA synthetase (AMP-forming)/AMP-acid ligase II [Tamaricihabitans halophyticus]
MTVRDEVLAALTAPGAPFEIGEADVLGEPMRVFANRHRALSELIRGSTRFGDRPYLVTEYGSLSFTAHYRAVAAIATALRTEYGVGKGDRVAICAPNCPEWIIAFWATVSLGAIAVGMNSMWTAQETEYGLDLTEPVLLVADGPRAELAGNREVPVLTVESGIPELIDRYADAELPEVQVDEDDPAVILFTSGTTGRAKGATHSHRNVLAACWFHLVNDAVATELGNPPGYRRFLLVTPLFHIASLHNLAVARLVDGDTAVLHLGRFDINEVLRLVERERVTNWGAVPTMVSRLIEHSQLAAYDLSSLRAISVNSAPSSPELKQRLREVLPAAERSLGTSYGLTESSTAATLASPADLRADPETVGSPVPTMEVEVRDVHGNAVVDGTEGEICLRGPQMMLGYWRDPRATEASSAPHRWFRTGDLGAMVDGQLRVSSRRSDLILRGGENVYPAEVENQLSTHPAVRECIVLGTPHQDLGQEVAAVVVVWPGIVVTEQELRDYVGTQIARYKVPSRWVITTHGLPRNATGKVNRAQVRLTSRG